jgi:hypothetical protein
MDRNPSVEHESGTLREYAMPLTPSRYPTPLQNARRRHAYASRQASYQLSWSGLMLHDKTRSFVQFVERDDLDAMDRSPEVRDWQYGWSVLTKAPLGNYWEKATRR